MYANVYDSTKGIVKYSSKLRKIIPLASSVLQGLGTAVLAAELQWINGKDKHQSTVNLACICGHFVDYGTREL